MRHTTYAMKNFRSESARSPVSAVLAKAREKKLAKARTKALSGVLAGALAVTLVAPLTAPLTASALAELPPVSVSTGTAKDVSGTGSTGATPGAVWSSSDAFTYAFNGDTAVITDYSGSAVSVAVPATVLGRPVTGIADGVFASHPEILRLDIPASVKSIGAGAFRDCTGLLTVTLPGVTSIGDSAFSGCTSLYFVDVGDSLRTLGARAFSGCTSLASLTLPDTLESVGAAAFSGCTALSDLVLLSGGTRLSSLPADALPGGVNVVTAASMSENAAGATFTVAAGQASGAELGYRTVVGGIEITSCRTSAAALVLPDTIDGRAVISIGEGAFASGCGALRAVVLPRGVTSIGAGAFRGLSSLSYVRMPDRLSAVLGGDSFRDCVSLRTIMVPEGTATVGMSAFAGCRSLELVTLPPTLGRILSGAFSGCTSLTRLYLRGDEPECGGKNSTDDMMAFGLVPAGMKVYTEAGRTWSTTSALWYPNGRSYSGGYVREALAVGHFYAESEYRAATCHSDGLRVFTCPFCGDSYSESSPMTEHEFVSMGVTDGIETFRCRYCTANYTRARIEACEVDIDFDITESGADVVRGLYVRFRGALLGQDVDYTYTVKFNGAQGRVEVEVVGIGGYTGRGEWGFSAYTGEALKRYTVTATGAQGGGEYYRGDTVRLAPSEPIPAGYEAVWTSDDVTLTVFPDGGAGFTMPARPVSVTLTLRPAPETTPPDTTPPDTEPVTTPPETPPDTTPPETVPPDTGITAPVETTTRPPYSHTDPGRQYLRTAILWSVVLFVSLAAFVGVCVTLFRRKR